MVTESAPLQERHPLLAVGATPSSVANPQGSGLHRQHHLHDLHDLHGLQHLGLGMESALSCGLGGPLGVPMTMPIQLAGRRETREREDPMSHRIIEKRRRDRMNNCLADLSRLIPAEYLKKGRGRVEKTEIIEMAIKHMQYLQTRANLAAGIDCSPAGPGDLRVQVTKCEQPEQSEQSPCSEADRAEAACMSLAEAPGPPAHTRAHTPTPAPADGVDGVEQADSALRPVVRPIVTEHYRLGYQECLSEAMHFLVEVEGYLAKDSLCVKLISHLQKHCDRIVKGDRLNFPRTRQQGEATSSSGSSNASNGGNSGSNSASTGFKGAPGSSSSPDEPQGHHPGLAHHGLAVSMASMAAAQLRDMMCPDEHCASPPSPTLSQRQYHASHALPQHCDNFTDTDGHHPAHHHHAYHDPHHHNSYKFKNTIKQRFSEEHSHGLGLGLLKRRRTMTRSPSPAHTHAASASQPSHASSQHTLHTQASVPIFVLHAKGAFYIPLTVSLEALAPYLDVDVLSDAGSARGSTLLGSSSLGTLPPSVVLHPVTISVNFQQCVKSPAPALHTPTALPLQAPVPLPLALVPPPQTTPTHQGHWARTESGSFVPVSPWEMSARQ